jgi:DNA end-binding protein Ku
MAMKSGPFDPKRFGDHYGSALKDLVQEKMKGHAIVAHETARPSGDKVINLMEAPKRSIEGATPAKGKASRGGKKQV